MKCEQHIVEHEDVISAVSNGDIFDSEPEALDVQLRCRRCKSKVFAFFIQEPNQKDLEIVEAWHNE